MIVILALIFVLAQGVVVWALLRFTKTFGAYVESNRQAIEMFGAAHQASMLLHEETVRMMAEIKRSHLTTEKVA